MSFKLPDPFIELPPGAVEDKSLKETVEAAQRNFDALTGQVGDLVATGGALRAVGPAGRKMNFGATNIGNFGGTAGVDGTISHGLGVTPTVVLVSCRSVNIPGDTTAGVVTAVDAFGSTTFVVRCRTNGYVACSNDAVVYWAVFN